MRRILKYFDRLKKPGEKKTHMTNAATVLNAIKIMAQA